MQQEQVRLEGEMQQERTRLEEGIQRLNQELGKIQEQNEKDQDALQVALNEKQSLEDAHSKLDDKYREKEAHLDKALARKSDLEEQLKKPSVNHEYEINKLQDQLKQLRSECSELQQQIAKANEDITAWSGDCQAKTQQINWYKKQVDQFQVQVDCLTAKVRENKAKMAEYEQQLGYYQSQVRQLNEDGKQKVRLTSLDNNIMYTMHYFFFIHLGHPKRDR